MASEIELKSWIACLEWVAKHHYTKHEPIAKKRKELRSQLQDLYKQREENKSDPINESSDLIRSKES